MGSVLVINHDLLAADEFIIWLLLFHPHLNIPLDLPFRAASIASSNLFLVTLDMTCNYLCGSLHEWASTVVIYHKISKGERPLKVPD